MASVFKLGRDKGRRNAHWYFEYFDHLGKKRMKKGFTDKGLTQQLAAKLESESRQRSLGLIDVVQEEQVVKKQATVTQQLLDYETALKSKVNSAKHVKLTLTRIRKVVKGCEFKTLADLNADEVETFLTELREEDDIGYRTYNHYLQAIDGWCNWMVGRKRLDRNPVLGIPRLNAGLDVRHPRRALTANEFGLLLKSARESDEFVRCYSGEERARIYTLSYMTGLRKGEIASLQPKSFDLDGKTPTVTIEAASSKHRKKGVLPLHLELVPFIREWTAGLGKNDPLFPKLGSRKTWLMVRKDLERIGIAYKTGDGIADFHAAGRHTHIMGLLRNGATVPEARELARHSDVRMTMRYTHITLEDQARAIQSLPLPVTVEEPVCQDEKPTCQDIVRKPSVAACHEVAGRASQLPPGRCDALGVNPCLCEGYDAECPRSSPAGDEKEKWRRRGSNPRPAMLP